MNATPESLIKDYADPIELQEIDKFVCSEMADRYTGISRVCRVLSKLC